MPTGSRMRLRRIAVVVVRHTGVRERLALESSATLAVRSKPVMGLLPVCRIRLTSVVAPGAVAVVARLRRGIGVRCAIDPGAEMRALCIRQVAPIRTRSPSGLWVSRTAQP